MLRCSSLAIFLAVLIGPNLAPGQLPAQEVTAERLLDLHVGAAAEYSVKLSEDSETVLELNRRPVLVWSNPRRANGQIGHVFVWTHEGRPAAIGTIFSHPVADPTKRRVYHEMHSLSETTIVPDRQRQPVQWKPRGGIKFRKIEGAPPVSPLAARRTLQIRQIARSFDANTVDREGQRWPLRMLSSPVLRYRKKQENGYGGALLSMLGDAGSDPELILMIEARVDAQGTANWYFAPVRMTDHESFLKFKGQLVWESVRTSTDTHMQSSDGTYQRFYDQTVDSPSDNDDEQVKDDE